jgi:glycosyltransferase involved in cell wall biosynthesis
MEAEKLRTVVRQRWRFMSKTWVVIPLYNEGQVIADVVTHVKSVFPHVVCIDDGSSDNSAVMAHSAGAVVVQHPINLGQGAALQTGFDFALADAAMSDVVTFDADGQHSLDDAHGMVKLLRAKKLDVVIGSRFLDSRTQMGAVKRAVLRVAALFTKLSTGMSLTDAHNGLRVINRNTLQRFQLKQNRMAHASEIVDIFSALKVTWAEYPTHIVYSEYSKAKGQSLLNSINILVELLFK